MIDFKYNTLNCTQHDTYRTHYKHALIKSKKKRFEQVHLHFLHTLRLSIRLFFTISSSKDGSFYLMFHTFTQYQFFFGCFSFYLPIKNQINFFFSFPNFITVNQFFLFELTLVYKNIKIPTKNKNLNRKWWTDERNPIAIGTEQ